MAYANVKTELDKTAEFQASRQADIDRLIELATQYKQSILDFKAGKGAILAEIADELAANPGDPAWTHADSEASKMVAGFDAQEATLDTIIGA